MKYGNWKLICSLCLMIILSGCHSFSEKSLVLAVPDDTNYQDEVKLAQISQQLFNQDIDDNTRIKLYYQRGVLYDSFGLRAFAQNDFSQILKYNASIPDAYNFLGIYAMQSGDLNAAFMAFNSALELDGNYQFAYINRAIGLYRSERFDVALVDAEKFYHYDINDPTRALWVYLIELKLDKSKAMLHLREHYNKLSDKNVWGSDIIAFYLGNMSEKQLMINLQKDVQSNKQLAGRLCETYFYLGKFYQNKGNNERAQLLFKLALASNMHNYLEHQQALYEIAQLSH